MLIGYYKGKRFYYNQYWMEIYEEKKGKLIKKRNSEDNFLSCRSIKEYNKKHF